MAKKRKLNIGSRRLKDSSQGTSATHTTSTHAQGSNVEETHPTSTHAQGSNAEETHTTSTHAQGSNVEETRANPSHVEVVTHESEDSYYIPSDIEAEEELEIIKDVQPKKKRGPTRMYDVWEMDPKSYIVVKMDKRGRFIGDEGSTLTRFIGSLVRMKQYAPINLTSWKDMPAKNKNDMVLQIEKFFGFDPPMNETTKEYLIHEMNMKWKQWKCSIKGNTFDESKTEEEVANAVLDSRVDRSQYRELVHHWFSEEAQKESKKNSQNRKRYEDIHCMGTKSLPKLINEMKEKAKGVSPTRKEIYIDTRTRKDGSIVNEHAARFIEELNKHNNEAETSQSVGTQSHMPWKNDIYSRVKGAEKRGHVRCIGNIPKPKKPKTTLSENQELRDELKKMRESQERTNVFMANMMSVIQNRLSQEDLNDILQAAKKATNGASTPNQINSSSRCSDEDGREED